MGNTMSWVYSFWQKEYFVAVLGLDGAGKTSLVEHLKVGYMGEPLPTIGFHITNVRVNNCMIQFADLAGQDAMRRIWGALYHSADAVVYVVDGTDLDRLPLAMSELKSVMTYPALEDKPFLILVNKHDENAVDVKVLKHQIVGDRWRAYNVSVKEGKGLDEAFLWLEANLL
jgi:ADP-ribosylation factor-like protein 1